MGRIIGGSYHKGVVSLKGRIIRGRIIGGGVVS